MKFSLMQIVSIIAAFQSIIFGSYFIRPRQKISSKNLILAGLMLTYTIMIFCSLLLSSVANKNLYSYAHIGNQIVFFVGPLLYLYIKSSLVPNYNLGKKDMIHALPYVLIVSYLIIKFYYIHIPITCRFNHILVGSLAFFQSFAYFYASTKLLKHQGLNLKQTFKTLSQNRLTLLPLLICGCFMIWLTKLLFFIIWDISAYYQGCTESINLFFLVSFLFFNTLLYLLLIKPKLFNHNEKYKHSLLKDFEKTQYKEKLINHMDKNKTYRNSLLSLNSLASQLRIPEKQLSQIINESLNMSFYDFVNWYRINDCTDYLSDENYSHLTILSIAYEAGFNSKSTFNTAFKKHIGVTPKEFRKTHIKSSF